MKQMLAPLLLLVLLFPSLALGEEITWDDLVKREGIYYHKFTDVPFTGKTTGIKQGTFKNGKKDGPWVDYWDNGHLFSKGNYKNNLREGAWILYYSNGQLWSKDNYKNGVPEGPYVSYYDNGQLNKKGDFMNGKQEGRWVDYWSNCQLRSEGDRKNGMREGPWVVYNLDGTVDEEFTGTYKNRVKVD